MIKRMGQKTFHLSRVFLSIALAFLTAFALIAGTATINLYKSKKMIQRLSQLEQNIFFPLSRAEEDIYYALMELKSKVSGSTPGRQDFFQSCLTNARLNLAVALEEAHLLVQEDSELTIPIKKTHEAVRAFEEQGNKAFKKSNLARKLRHQMSIRINTILHRVQNIQYDLASRLLKIPASDPDRLFPSQGINDISSLKLQLLEFKNCVDKNLRNGSLDNTGAKVCENKLLDASFLLDCLLLEIPSNRHALKEMIHILNSLKQNYQEVFRAVNASHESLDRARALANELSGNLELCRKALATFNRKINEMATKSGQRMTRWLFFSVIFYLGILGIAASWLKKQVIAPLETLNRSLAEIGSGKMVSRPLDSKAEEISKVARQVSRMAEQLKNREEKLIDAKKKWQSAFQAIGGPVVLLSPEFNILECNHEFLKLAGASRFEDVMGRAFSEFFSEDELDGCCTREDQLEELKKGLRFEKNLKGRPFYLSASPVLDSNGELSGIIVVATDLTEMKRLEERLRRAQKMEALGTLAGGVAHDLNNILTGIVTYPDILLMQLPEDSPLAKPVRIIQQSGQRAADVVQDLLTLARRAIGTREPLNLNGIIRDYLDSPECQKLLLENPDIKVETRLSHDLMNMKGSPTHLSKTVMNLFTNAIEAMPSGGKLYISTENCYLDEPVAGYDHIDPGDYIKLLIRDTGEGISENDLPHIFEPFYTKKVMGRSGSGLGMAVVWGTVKDHNGYIDIQTEVGKGTSLSIYFPVTRSAPEQETGNSADINELKGNGKILVVDDMDEQREIASSILRRLGYDVETVPCGESAIELCREKEFDLLLLDMIMDPGIDGLETYEAIVKIRPGQKAIITSGFSETDRVKKALDLGAARYIRKPYTFDKLARAVRDALDSMIS